MKRWCLAVGLAVLSLTSLPAFAHGESPALSTDLQELLQPGGEGCAAAAEPVFLSTQSTPSNLQYCREQLNLCLDYYCSFDPNCIDICDCQFKQCMGQMCL
jgi:hypothetical protein